MSVSLNEIIDKQRFTGLQVRIAAICAAVAFCDGYSVQAVNYAAPSIRDALDLSPTQLGAIFSLSLVGMTIGSFAIGPIADRIGRRHPLVWLTLAFGLLTATTALATSFWHVALLRLLDGVALGSALPNAYVLVGEYSAKNNRRLSISAVILGYTLGGFGAGMLAVPLIADYGWQAVFLVGGGAALLTATAGLLWVPESLGVLLRDPKKHRRAASVIARIAPEFGGPIGSLTVPSATRETGAIRTILGPKYLTITLCIWVIGFSSMMVALLFYSWTPIILKDAGMTLAQAVRVTVLFNVGTMIAALAGGWLMDRYRAGRVILWLYVVSGIAFGGMGFVAGHPLQLTALALIAGLGLGGVLTGIGVLPATIYPARARVTGSGWAIGVARFGGVVGPLIGATWIEANLRGTDLFFVAAVLGVIAMAAALVMLGTYQPTGEE